MSRTYNVREFLQAAGAQRQEMTRALSTAEHARRRHYAERGGLEQSAQQADIDLGRALLPDVSSAAVERAVTLTGYTPLRDMSGTLEAERAQLSATVARLEADPRFRDRELLRHPRTGTLSTQIAQLQDMRATLTPTLEACDHSRMATLLENGYGTPDYRVGFWRLSYYRDWEAADEIVARMKKASFAEVIPEFTRARDAAGELESELSRLASEVQAGEALEQEHRAASEGLASLESRYLEHAQRLLVKHLLEADKTRTGALLDREPNVRLLALKSQATRSKLEYLDGLHKEKVETFAAQTKVALDKLDRDVAKYQRPKNAYAQFPSESFERRFRDPRERYQKHWDRYNTTYQTIYVYEDYDRGRWVSDFLWWDAMTHGMDGGYIPSVHYHHDHYGTTDYSSGRDDRDDDLAEAAAATATLEVEHSATESASSTFDPS